MTKPFIYVCSLRRTGSTVISEALTLLPHSFIFREPRLPDRKFTLKQHDVELFRTHAIDLEWFARRWATTASASRVTLFRKELLPILLKVCAQVGVKEIHNRGWQEYVRSFAPIRLILTARDPRDIFLSLHDRIQKGKSSWKGPFGPKPLAAHLSEEFEYQLAASESAPSFRVRYEDFCTNDDTLAALKEFVESDVPGFGSIGALNASNPNRIAEFELHGDRITAKRIARWQEQADGELREDAFRMLDLMPAYCKYWGYYTDSSAASTP